MTGEIPVHCWTNVDSMRTEAWPRWMVVRPLVGDVVESESGKQMKVVRVIHKAGRKRMEGAFQTFGMEPFLEVELHW